METHWWFKRPGWFVTTWGQIVIFYAAFLIIGSFLMGMSAAEFQIAIAFVVAFKAAMWISDNLVTTSPPKAVDKQNN